MRNGLVLLGMVVLANSILLGQATSGTQASPAKPASAPKPATAQPTAIFDTTAGKMTCTLFPDKAPIGVANFIGLATGTKDWKSPTGATKHGVPLYDGTIFHRVIPQFMIQGGDPAGTGSGPDPVKPFGIEVSRDLLFDRPGRLAYAKTSAPISISSQFFITEVAYTSLNGQYTIFGQCDDDSVALVKRIAAMSRDSNDRPYRPIKINHITIQKPGETAKSATAPAKKPAAATTPKPATTPK